MTFLRLRRATPAEANSSPGPTGLAPGTTLVAPRGPGRPFPESVRPLPESAERSVEPRLGFDFGKMRVHGGPEAALPIQRQDDEEEPGSGPGPEAESEPEAEAETEPASRPRRGVRAARTEAADAMDRAIEEVREAITDVEAGRPVPEPVATALGRFFPRETGEFLPLLLRRIELVRRIIETVRVRRISRPLDVAIEPHAIEVNAVLRLGWPAGAFPPDFIALFPRFYRQPDLQPTRLLHEAFHWYFPSFVHHGRNTRGDAFAYQGFVSLLGGLEQDVPLRRYPAPGPEGEEEGQEAPPSAPEVQPKLRAVD